MLGPPRPDRSAAFKRPRRPVTRAGGSARLVFRTAEAAPVGLAVAMPAGPSASSRSPRYSTGRYMAAVNQRPISVRRKQSNQLNKTSFGENVGFHDIWQRPGQLFGPSPNHRPTYLSPLWRRISVIFLRRAPAPKARGGAVPHSLPPVRCRKAGTQGDEKLDGGYRPVGRESLPGDHQLRSESARPPPPAAMSGPTPRLKPPSRTLGRRPAHPRLQRGRRPT